MVRVSTVGGIPHEPRVDRSPKAGPLCHSMRGEGSSCTTQIHASFAVEYPKLLTPCTDERAYRRYDTFSVKRRPQRPSGASRLAYQDLVDAEGQEHSSRLKGDSSRLKQDVRNQVRSEKVPEHG
jgi:hypothetical protein